MKKRVYTAVIERDLETGLYVAHVPGLPGAHTQAADMDELKKNLHEVLELVLDGEDPPKLDTEFIGTQSVVV